MGNVNIYELIYHYHMDNDHAMELLIQHVKPLLVNWVNDRLQTNFQGSYFYFDDLYQEAIIALYEAVEIFREDRAVAFTTFLKSIVENKLKNATRSLLKKSEIPLSKLVSMDALSNEKNAPTIYSFVNERGLAEPEYYLNVMESIPKVNEALSEMSEGERNVLVLWMQDYSYLEGGKKLGIGIREFEGKLRRARKKMQAYCLPNKYKS